MKYRKKNIVRVDALFPSSLCLTVEVLFKRAICVFSSLKCLQILRNWTQIPIFTTSCLWLCNGEIITTGSNCYLRLRKITTRISFVVLHETHIIT